VPGVEAYGFPVEKLRVVTYNVRALRGDRAAVSRVLRSLDADIVCLQEAPRLFRWRSRCAALARESGLLYVAGGGTAEGVAMLAAMRVDIDAVVEQQLSRSPRLRRRGFVAARIRKAGAPCTVASVHLGLGAAEHPRHIAEIRGVLNRFGEEVEVLAGDFNETPGGATWRRLASEFVDAGEGDGSPTFPATKPRKRIDGVFVGGPASVTAYRVVDDDDVKVASDHRPVVVDVELGRT